MVGMGWCANSGSVLLVIFSVVSVDRGGRLDKNNPSYNLISIILLTAGGILKFSPDLTLHLLSNNPDVSNNVVPLPETAGDVPLLGEAGVVVMLLGGVICGVSFMACCGGCCKCRCLLLAFATFHILMAGSLTVLTALFMVRDSVLHSTTRGFLSQETRQQYNHDRDGEFMQIINLISIKMKCCGIVGPEDLDPDWANDPNAVHVTSACCKSLSDMTCQSNNPTARAAGDIHLTGCYERLLDNIEEYKNFIIMSVSAVLVIMLIEVALAIGIVVDITRSKRKVAPK